MAGDDSTDATATAQPSGNTVDALPLANVLDPVTSLLSDTTGGTTGDSLPIVGNLLDGGGLADGSSLTLAGADGTLQPVLNAANALIKDFHNNVLEALSHEIGASDLIHNVTNTGETVGLGTIGVPTPSPTDGHTNLVTDLLNAPATLLDGGGLGTVISQVGSDLTDDVHAVDGIVNSLLNTQDGLNVLPTVTRELGSDLQNLPLLSVNGDSGSGGGGLLDGLVGNLHGSDTGHLVDVNVGPEQPNGQAIDILAQPTTGDHHTVDVSAVDIGQNGPHLLDLNALTGSGGLNLPSLGGTGTDGLTGNLLGNLNLGNLLSGGIASGNTTTAPVSAPLDVTAVLHDLVSSPLTTDHGLLDTHGTHIL
ncbi:hypothetical protein [Bradyrhizobium sp.]|uniref:hypothetical protein n=1 Tax=Bradyrhizobium sp. TaxID=376 RepID=UPI0039E3F8EA